ncbi:Rieske (2Fe-2S) protein [Actinosynnema sp. CA-299493]
MSSLEKTGLSRRSMLCGVLVALAVPGGLAACGSGTTPSGAGTTGGTAPGGTTPAGPPIIAALADVPEGGGMIAGNPANGKPLVLVRTGETVKAYDATCPHQGTAVSPPEGGVITCPNHGSTFNAADGAVTKGPATKGLAEVPVKVEAGQVVPA